MATGFSADSEQLERKAAVAVKPAATRMPGSPISKAASRARPPRFRDLARRNRRRLTASTSSSCGRWPAHESRGLPLTRNFLPKKLDGGCEIGVERNLHGDLGQGIPADDGRVLDRIRGEFLVRDHE